MSQDITAENRKLLDKIVIEGKLHKLFRKAIKSEKDIDYWDDGFLQSFEAHDRDVILNHKILWRKQDKDSAEAPPYGVAADWNQLKWLIDHERITRAMCDVDLTEWVNMCKITEFRFKDETADGVTYGATPVAEKRTLDKVVSFITDKLYVGETAPGAKTARYFAEYKTNFIAMQRMYHKGTSFLLDEIKSIFEGGHYITWRETIKEMKEHCGFKEEQHDIIDIFIKIKDIAMKSSKEMPM